MNEIVTLLERWVRQQIELGMPPLFCMGSANCFGYRSISSGLAEPARGGSGLKKAAAAGGGRRAFSSLSESVADVRQRMAELWKEVRSCRRCSLSAGRSTIVFGSGNVYGCIMVIGEAPGAEEDRQGLPFVGAAGQLFTKMLAAVHLDREKDVFITNVVKCRPPQNRTPTEAEIAACSGLLRAQINVMRPSLLLLLGRVAAQTVLGCSNSVAELRGRVHSAAGIPAVVTYHPAALLRRESLKREAWDDLKIMRELLRREAINGSQTR